MISMTLRILFNPHTLFIRKGLQSHKKNKNLHNRNQSNNNNKKASVRGFTSGPKSAYFMIKPPVKTHIFKPSLSPHSDCSKALSAYEISILDNTLLCGFTRVL